MEKVTGLYIKSKGKWSILGELDSDVRSKTEQLKEITDAQGRVSKGKTNVQLEAAMVVHNTKGVIKSRKW